MPTHTFAQHQLQQVIEALYREKPDAEFRAQVSQKLINRYYWPV